MKRTFYITTPIYYVNDLPHLGHAYTTIAADVLARYKRLAGFQTFFLTGSDEHGQKIERAAGEKKEKPIELANRVVKRFQNLWEKLSISNDDFIRTSEERHWQVVRSLFEKVYKKGDIYLGRYEDWYCTPCETFWTEKQLKEGRCPDCLRKVERLGEESYFFKMSAYQNQLLSYLKENPDFIQPKTRYNEILSFVEQGLKDLSISRTSFSWGVPVPSNPQHVIYVWFDALTNYLSGVGYLNDSSKFHKFWPADLHLIGKDILRFHAVYWPTFLLSLDLPLPRRIFAHGWWTVEGQKMSKSLGNVVDPGQLAECYGTDALRYFLLREVPFGLDGDFSQRALIQRINSDLANDLGNLFSRSITMALKYFKGRVKRASQSEGIEERLKETAEKVEREIEVFMDQMAFHRALGSIWELINMTNKYLDETAPWSLAKDKRQKERLTTVISNTLEALKVITILIFPFLPGTAQKMKDSLGIKEDFYNLGLKGIRVWKGGEEEKVVNPILSLFPRIQE